MKKILIIDDDNELTELLIEFLGSYKYEIVAIHDPEKGLAYLEKNNDINVIILDIMLPGMDGFQVLRKIRENSQWLHISDEYIREVDQKAVYTSQAYMLFYQKNGVTFGSSESQTSNTGAARDSDDDDDDDYNGYCDDIE